MFSLSFPLEVPPAPAMSPLSCSLLLLLQTYLKLTGKVFAKAVQAL